jgi:Cellulose binding domain/Fibronectin type III domain
MKKRAFATRARRWRRTAALAALVLGVGGVSLVGAPARADTSVVNVRVNAREGLGVLPGTAYGANQAVWDGNMNTPATADLLGQAGVRVMRYPGGSYGDGYHWRTSTVDGGGWVAPGTDFDSFMGTTRTMGAQPMVIANYGSGTAQEAADWVRYANVTKNYGVKYWEIGNEVFGNGYYGANWELDQHADKSPAAYAHQVVEYARAMKAVDPTIKIGVVLTLPGSWPDGVVASGDSGDWNRTVLPVVGPYVDFGIVHYYPNHTTAADVLQQIQLVPAELAQLRLKIDRYAGANGPDIGIAVTETQSNFQAATQPGALFTADAYLTLLESGVFTVDYWDTRNGMPEDGVTTSPTGATDYGDGGLLSSGNCNSHDVCEPPLNTPFASYYGLQMLSRVAQPGDTLVKAGSDSRLLGVHAARNADGGLSVELVNKDPDNAHEVDLSYDGWLPDDAVPTVHRYLPEAPAITTARLGTANHQVVPAYSIVTVKLRPAEDNPVSTDVGRPGAPRLTQVGDTTATITWPAADGRVTRYGVHEQRGTTTNLLADTTATSVTLRNLRPGNAYTVNVLATDQRGRLSLPSAPLTFVTGTPRDSTCAVTYSLASGWTSGFVANVSVTNTGPTPISGWTLAFRFPADTETIASAWNVKYRQEGQDGRDVVVTPGDWNGTLAAAGGNSADFGFVGNQTGANPPPASFTLNGTVCSTTYDF